MIPVTCCVVSVRVSEPSALVADAGAGDESESGSDVAVGTIKRAMGHGYFLMRGLSKVGAEMSLTVLSYNLKRVINLIGVQKMIAAVT